MPTATKPVYQLSVICSTQHTRQISLSGKTRHLCIVRTPCSALARVVYNPNPNPNPNPITLTLTLTLTLTNGIYSDPTAAQVLQKRPTIAYRRHSNIGEMLVRARFNSVVDHNSSICHTTDVNDNSTNTRSHDVNDVHDHLTNHTSG